MALKDRLSNLMKTLRTHTKGLWKAIKGLKRKFTPQYVQMKNEHGKHVPIIEMAQTIANYLESTHWKNDLNTGMPDAAPILLNNAANRQLLLRSTYRALSCEGRPPLQKGDTDNAANYRPISLLSSLYTVYMIMIRQRNVFRPQRSTSHAIYIYIIHRLQDYAESKGPD